ncbi:hypothetical protein MtrunA17_Chr7g0216591 [Medicago truncatula]|uniref:Transmembrane protein n=1 Tax=Medicago truncatula TaxID=3880 RepID=A0A396GT11_MEDTR|nr:hypothetical protein MtrunA17_Chr7g0216591 [Medicago truncatula]
MFGLTVRMENRGCTKILLKLQNVTFVKVTVSFGLEMKNLLIFMRRDLVMLVIFILCLEGLRTVVMVCYNLQRTPSLKKIHFSILSFVHVFVIMSPITQSSC